MNGRRETPARALVILFVTVLLVALFLLSLSWHGSLLDRYEFRQLQTALTAHWIALDGWQLAYPTPLFGPPWSIPMELPTYQVAVAGLHHLTGLPLEQSGRLLSIVMLLLCLPALHDLLACAGLKSSRRLIVAVAVLSAPVYLFYGRAFMIETTALCGGVWFLALLRRSLIQSSTGWIVATTVAAVFTALTKVTTFAVFALPAVALVLAAWQDQSQARLRVAVAALTPALLAFGAAWSWVHFSDGVKDANPFTGFLTSRELETWNFGPMALRADWSFWVHLQEVITGYNLAEGALAIALLCVPFAARRVRLIAAVAVAGFFTGPLVFANLYHLHDYYYAANSLLLVGAAGLLIASIWDDPRLPRGANWLALGLFLVFQFHAYYRGYYSHHRNPAPPPPGLAAVIRKQVPADGVVVIFGADWNPLLPYYMERRAVMVPGERENDTAVLDEVLSLLPGIPVSAVVVHGERLRSDPAFGPAQARRFGLDHAPAARSDSDDLYLPSGAAVGPALADVTVLRVKREAPWTEGLQPATIEFGALEMIAPRPIAILSRYGVAIAPTPAGPGLNAHAPSELILPKSDAAGILVATYGLADGAFAPGADAQTDGIALTVLLENADGTLQRLYHRRLDPAHTPADRGPQTLRLPLPASRGKLHLRLDNGLKGDPTNDWAYWSDVRVD
ncbi:MAG: hypothetical protein RLZ98_236 [Pseudomonadota bacterium]|jgi:hypothetical protein